MISIIIPTLGGKHLNKTIASIKDSSILPEEILLCISKLYKKNISLTQDDLVKIITTESSGQVLQRSTALKNTKSDHF